MRVYTLKRKQLVDRPLEDVFAFFEQPENLEKLTPSNLGFKILTPSPISMKTGALIDYSLNIFGLPQRWTTLISEYDPPYKFVDVQLRGPYAFWHHTHTFEQTDQGTIIQDEVRYMLPFGILGQLVHALAVEGQLSYIFNYRAKMIEKLLPRDMAEEQVSF